MKKIKIILAILASSVLILLVTGLVYETVSRMKAQKYAKGETFVDVGGYKLHYKAMGTGKPTVVFESGLDPAGLLPWYKVQPEVAKFASTISYDRAGILMSQRGNKAKTGENMATDLYTLLKKTGQGPYILVGHSMAGINLRSFVDKYPNEVVGIVLVDVSHPLQKKRFAKFPPPPADWITYLKCKIGFTRFMYDEYTYPSTSPSDSINVIAAAFEPMSLPAFFEEFRALYSIADNAEHLKNFGNIPLIVITGIDKKKREMEGMGETMKAWIGFQNDLLKLSTNSKHIFATNSGHYVQLDEPRLVIDAVHQLVDDVKKDSILVTSRIVN